MLASLPEFGVQLCPVENDSTSTYCAYCKCELHAKFTDLQKFSQRQEHKKSSDNRL